MNARSIVLVISRGALLLTAAASNPALASDRVLRAELVINAPVQEVWDAWTTKAGLESFFTPRAEIDLRVDGTLDIWFDPTAEPGLRGAEGMRILDVDPLRRFAFTWNAPPSIPAIRNRWSMVVLDFSPQGEQKTGLRFTHLGWGDGPEWDQAYDYFDQAWGRFVLPMLIERFAHGPVDWSAPPEVLPMSTSLKRELTMRTTGMTE